MTTQNIRLIGNYVQPLLLTMGSFVYMNHPLACVVQTVTGVGFNAIFAYQNYRDNELQKSFLKISGVIVAGIVAAAVFAGGSPPLLITASAINMLLYGTQGLLALGGENKELEAAYYFVNAANSAFLSSSPILSLTAIGINTLFFAVETARSINKNKISWLFPYCLVSTAIYGFMFKNKLPIVYQS